MKAFRTPLILLVVLLALGVLAYWDEFMTEREQKEETTRNSLLSLSLDEVASFVFESRPSEESKKSGLRLEARRTDDGWQIDSPVISKGDAATIEELLQSAIAYRFERALESQSQNLAEYGLDKPKIQLTLTDKSGGYQTLSIGENAPIGYSSYVSLAEGDKVYLGSQYIVQALSKTLYDLRSKHLAIPSVSSITSLKFQNRHKEHFTFIKDESLAWRMTEPENLKIDQDELESLILELQGTRVREFIDEPSTSLAHALQLSNAATEHTADITFLSDEDTLFSLSILSNNDELYARLANGQGFLRLDEGLSELFSKSLWDFRFKDVFSFDSNDIERIQIDDRIYIKKDYRWYEDDDEELLRHYDHVRSFLVDLEFAKALELLDLQQISEQGRLPDTIDHRLAIYLDDHVPITVDIWKIEGSDTVIIKKLDDPIYYVVGSEILDDIAQRVTEINDLPEDDQQSDS